ncbi:cysteine proteinase [Tilletiaria anomala UBC 951]|uniref:Ubiquitin carboxyl-terminal hydrolase n=1 Tax=Tilletiaria anomala (strain ATCC 24038 / CBS 436.72 / UBC 951) TaxID=1037660 RepID=A0A066VCH1_TILAU|nr:cysteine proteinase [Tilletiaria anomala UBC 951]KDN39171.1 cysteine proteinase [Tilletiaria anomala UBC 951]
MPSSPPVPSICIATLSFATITTVAAAESGFVLVEPGQKLPYPLFGIFPLSLDLQTQAIIGATLLVVIFSAGFFIFCEDSESVIEELQQQVQPIFYLLGQAAHWLLSETMAPVSAGLGLGTEVTSRIHRFTLGRHSSRPADPSHASLVVRASKRPRGASGLRRAQPKAGRSSETVFTQALQHHPGLHNTGNTCFFNSVLQSLASVEGVNEYLEGIMSLAENWDVATPVTDALHDMISVLNTPGCKPSAVYPSDVSRALGQVSLMNGTRSLVGAHQQQDAHELLVLLTNAIDDELSTVKAYRAEVLRLSRGGLRAALPLAFLEEPPSREDPSNSFRGLTAQRTSCYTCGYTEAIRHHAFEELSLSVPAYGCTLEHCLARWTEVEEVEWVCHACSMRRTAESLAADCARLEGTATGPIKALVNRASREQSKPKAKGSSLPKGESISASKKKRLKEVRKAEACVNMVIQMRMHEDEAMRSGLLEGIKLDRTPSPSSTKQVMIARASHTLVIHLNRSSYYGSFGATKNNASVRFGEFLDLRPFTTNGRLSVAADEPISRCDAVDRPPLASGGQWAGAVELSVEERIQHLFRLQSVVVHLGGHHFGHYIAFRRRPDLGAWRAPSDLDLKVPTINASSSSDWLQISDESVRPCSLNDVLAQHAFLLFYERVAPPASSKRHARSTVDGVDIKPSAEHVQAPKGMENLVLEKEQRMRRLMQPKTVARWSVEPGSSTPGSRQASVMPSD